MRPKNPNEHVNSTENLSDDFRNFILNIASPLFVDWEKAAEQMQSYSASFCGEKVFLGGVLPGEIKGSLTHDESLCFPSATIHGGERTIATTFTRVNETPDPLRST